MPRKKQASKGQRRRAVAPAVGVIGLSLSAAGSASAGTSGPATDISSRDTTRRPEMSLSLHEEEVSDVTLATFYVFDKENYLHDKEAVGALRGGVQNAQIIFGCRCGCRACRCGCRGCRCGGCRCGCGGCRC